MSSELEDWHPRGIDPTTPSPARMYDYYLGGKDNFQADREAAEQALGAVANGRELVLENRRFLGRAVRYLVGQAGIRQIIDLGTGLPTQNNVHEVAHGIAPDTRVAYVDNDPIVLAHARALLGGGGSTDTVQVIEADMRHPAEIIEGTQGFIDFERPVAVLFVAVLHFVSDDYDPHATVARIRDATAPGSYLALSHVEASPKTAAAERAWDRATTQANWRSRSEVERFFDGFDLVDPGLVYTPEWRPDGGEFPGQAILAGVGRKSVNA